MSEEKVLTVDIARDFLTDEASQELIESCSSITNEAAQSLINYQGSYLCLNGLKSLSETEAEYLSQYKGELLMYRAD